MIGTLLLCASLIVVDGDTIKCNGQLMRDMGDGRPYVSGFDTPEIGPHAHCVAERALGNKAKARAKQLIETPGVVIYDSGEIERHWNRPLVSIRMPDGRSIGSILIAEGLARPWTPEYEGDWC